MKKSEAIEEILGPQHLSSPRSNDELEVISELTKYVEKIEGDALDEVEGGEDIVYFMRSGSGSSANNTRLYWMGDQLTTLDRFDGL